MGSNPTRSIVQYFEFIFLCVLTQWLNKDKYLYSIFLYFQRNCFKNIFKCLWLENFKEITNILAKRGFSKNYFLRKKLLPFIFLFIFIFFFFNRFEDFFENFKVCFNTTTISGVNIYIQFPFHIINKCLRKLSIGAFPKKKLDNLFLLKSILKLDK